MPKPAPALTGGTPWLLGIALLAGAFVRLWMLGAHSLLIDEAFVAVGARDILRNHTPMWDAISNAPFVWSVGQLLGLRGLADPTLLRLPAAIAGVATIIPLYFLTRRMFGARVASASAILYALHPFAVAFSRVLFSDPFQVFFILCGWLAFDRILFSKTSGWPGIRNMSIVALIWALAFLAKYNAVVPGALWLLAGVLAGRYRVGPAVACLAAMALGAIATLAIWPYDAPIWLSAFLEKGGSYNVTLSAFYFESKLHLVLFGASEVILFAAIAIALRAREMRAQSLGHSALFILGYLVTVIFLGRTFERYLLVCVPLGCMLLAGLSAYAIQELIAAKRRWLRAGIALVLGASIGIFLMGAYKSYRSYWTYLKNDTDASAIARTVTDLEHDGRHGYWLIPEPIGAYYLGFSQYYSRAAGIDAQDSLADFNHFEFSAQPYSGERTPYSVLEVRRLARQWGVGRLASMPGAFIRAAMAWRDTVEAPRIGSMDYFTSTALHSRDILIMQCGLRDVQGEPILEPIDTQQLPPSFTRLPLDRFQVYRTFRPEGLSLTADTTMDSVRAGSWILLRK
ncbi:MAG: glycosyltransferase family 39 protein [Bacteroidota bacterium]|nr:glycosyltransferase family 39 protein [Bacteroidota bacterium]